MTRIKKRSWTSEMTQWTEAPATESDDQVVLWPPQVYAVG